MFPDWKHLIKKWRDQILNVRRVLVLGTRNVMMEDLMHLYEEKKIDKWPVEKGQAERGCCHTDSTAKGLTMLTRLGGAMH